MSSLLQRFKEKGDKVYYLSAGNDANYLVASCYRKTYDSLLGHYRNDISHHGTLVNRNKWGTHNIFRSPEGRGRHEVEVTTGVEDAKKLADKLIDSGKSKPYIIDYKGK